MRPVIEDPAAFLKARLDEDEAAARRAASDPVGAMEAAFEAEALGEEQDWESFPERKTAYSQGQAAAMHWAAKVIRERAMPLSLHDPARALREVEAKRRIISHHDDNHDCADLSGTEFPYVGCTVIRAFAAVYSDHPGYRPEWKQAA